MIVSLNRQDYNKQSRFATKLSLEIFSEVQKIFPLHYTILYILQSLSNQTRLQQPVNNNLVYL